MSSAAGSLPDTAAGLRPRRLYLHTIVISLIGAVVILLWFMAFAGLSRLIWDNSVVAGNRWLFPLICLPFSLAVGLLVKYAQAPTNLGSGSLIDSLTGDSGAIEWRKLPVTIVQSLVSLLSGAVLGPEGAVGHIAGQLAALYCEKVRIPAEQRAKLIFATVSSSYNGLLENPVFTAVLSTEVSARKGLGLEALPASLVGGAVGYFVFFVAHSQGFANVLDLPAVEQYELLDVVLMVPLALTGLVLAIVTGLFMKAAAAVFGRFGERVVLRALVAGVVFSVAGVAAPIVMFSGESQIHTVIEDPARYGIGLLLLMAFVKLALLAVGFKSGFLGGPIFPIIFASVSVALAINLAVPGVPIAILAAGIVGGAAYVVFRAPLMVILLTGFMLGADLTLTALVVLAVATAMIAMPPIESRMAARQAARAQAAPPDAPEPADAEGRS